MSPIHPPFDWKNRSEFDWGSAEGLRLIQEKVSSFLDFTPHPFQLACSAKLLMGTDVICITATGDGKSALVYLPAIVREGMISLQVSPTNFLEHDFEKSLRKKGLSAVVINGETLAAADLGNPKRNLWGEAMSGLHQVILLGPETLESDQFNRFLLNPFVRTRLAQFTVDELHLIDEWGATFRVAYQVIATMRARLPDHTVMLGLSASLEPGRQFEACIRALGMHHKDYHLEKRDCERRNVELVMRQIKYSSTTYQFRDLDWLIPPNMTKASEVPKRIVFCQTIENGHRLVVYLRSLLPPNLRPIAKTLVRHHHSLNCPDCKSDGLDSLYKLSNERDCAVHVSTDVLSVGVDIPDLPEVIIFGTISSLSSLIQRAGRPAREPGSHGKAIIYIKKTDMKLAKEYLKSDKGSQDLRLLTEKDPHSHVETAVQSEPTEDPACAESQDHDPDGEEDLDLEEPATSTQSPQLTTSVEPVPPTSHKRLVKRAFTAAKGKPHGIQKTGVCFSYLLLIAAFTFHRCLIRQINIIYGNPGVNKDCGRCSSCKGDTIPKPRPKGPVDDSPPEDRTSTSQSRIQGESIRALPAYMKPKAKDLKMLSQELKRAAQNMRWNTDYRWDNSLLIGCEIFLPPSILKKITTDFLLLTSKEKLEERLGASWRYWGEFGSSLWEIVHERVGRLTTMLEDQHHKVLEKQRQGRVRKHLAAVGLAGVKRVYLKLPASETHMQTSETDNSHSSPTIEPSATVVPPSRACASSIPVPAVVIPIPPNIFYAAVRENSPHPCGTKRNTSPCIRASKRQCTTIHRTSGKENVPRAPRRTQKSKRK